MPMTDNTPRQSHRKKRPGAPKGNLNALKHGFYSRRFQGAELDQLKVLSEPGLTNEIEMLRLVIRRVIDRIDDVESLEQLLRYLSTISLATAQLSRLLKTQRLLVGEVDDIERALQQAIHFLNQENDHDSDSPPTP